MWIWLLGGGAAAAVALAAVHQRRPLREVLLSAFCGCCTLGLVNVLANWTGVSIALNYTTAFVSVVLGAPGVILLLAVRPFV